MACQAALAAAAPKAVATACSTAGRRHLPAPAPAAVSTSYVHVLQSSQIARRHGTPGGRSMLLPRPPAPGCPGRRRRGPPALLALRVENRELVVGDCVSLLLFCFYKQISAVVLSPDFAGWLAPLRFNPTQLSEFASLVLCLTATWVASGLVCGGYKTSATSDLPSTLTKISQMWLATMPVVAAQLVLATAVESRALVGDEGWASVLPLMARGPGEPFVSASGILGLMAVWRSFYCLYLDIFSLRWRQQVMHEMASFQQALLVAALMAAVSSVLLQALQAADRYLPGGI